MLALTGLGRLGVGAMAAAERAGERGGERGGGAAAEEEEAGRNPWNPSIERISILRSQSPQRRSRSGRGERGEGGEGEGAGGGGEGEGGGAGGAGGAGEGGGVVRGRRAAGRSLLEAQRRKEAAAL